MVVFLDAERVEWRVCEVTRAQVDAHPEREQAERTAGRRRVMREILPGLDGGWLSFACWREKRRLVDYPIGWRDLSPVELRLLCQQAAVVRDRRADGDRTGTSAD